MKHILSLFFIQIFIIHLSGQGEVKVVPGEVIVQFKSETSFNEFLKLYEKNTHHFDFYYKKDISKTLNAHLFEYDEVEYNFEEIKNRLYQFSQVNWVQPNHISELRNGKTPNDIFYSDQWQYDLICAPEAWERTTGGQTATGDQIVVSVVDAGFDFNHEDFEGVIYTNEKEIPDDGLDNDDNGYVDDYRGWNSDIEIDNHNLHPHGTSVAGIVGAKGNNGIGVTGISWNGTVLIQSGFLTESLALGSYEYALQQRKLYNENNGAKGAFVVAINSSFGFSNNFPSAMPLYCEMLDKLGEVGILSIGATTNQEKEVHVTGDIPSLCPSDYSIIVTNLGPDDERFFPSGYSDLAVDLAAPGATAYTVEVNNDYGGFGGTSGATPHVAGTVGLIYSYPSANFMEAVYQRPDSMALVVKNYILNNVEQRPSLDGTTVTGGRLSLCRIFESMDRKMKPSGSGGCMSEFDIYLNPLSNTMRLETQLGAEGAYRIAIFNSIGQVLGQVENFQPNLAFMEINMPPLNNGVYFLSIECPDGSITSKAFFVD